MFANNLIVSRASYEDLESGVSGKDRASSDEDTDMEDSDPLGDDPEGLPGPPADLEYYPQPEVDPLTDCSTHLDEEQGKRRRHYLGTINLGDAEGSTLPHWEEMPPGVRFLTWQKEKVTREHLQVFVEFDMNKTVSACRAVFGGGFWKPAKNTAKSVEFCTLYCRKCCNACFKGLVCTGLERLDGPWTLGKSTSQGKRTEVDRLASAVVKTNYEAAFLKYPGTAMKFPTGAKEYQRILSKRNRGEAFRPPRILTVIGAAGGTKTAMRDMFRGYFDPDDDYEQRLFSKPFAAHIQDPEAPWWAGYVDQDTVVLDDFYGQLKYSYFIKLIDGWPRTEAIKNGHVVLNNRYWVITSNAMPWNWYNFQGCKNALYDRLWGESPNRVHWDTCVFDMDSKSFVPPFYCRCSTCLLKYPGRGAEANTGPVVHALPLAFTRPASPEPESAVLQRDRRASLFRAVASAAPRGFAPTPFTRDV